VQDYQSTIAVGVDSKGSALVWTGSFKAKSAPDAEAKKVIEGIYEAGGKSLTN
jgi:hypothetical protein